MKNKGKKIGICIFNFFLLSIIVFSMYKMKPYIINIQYSAQVDYADTGVEKIIVSEIKKDKINYTQNNFEYNVEKQRFECTMLDDESSYINFRIHPFQEFYCKLEYRLKNEDSIIDKSEGVFITVYCGDTPIYQEIFPLTGTALFSEDIRENYRLDSPISLFFLVYFVGFLIAISNGLQLCDDKKINPMFLGFIFTVAWIIIWIVGVNLNAPVKRDAFNTFLGFYSIPFVVGSFWKIVKNIKQGGRGFVREAIKQMTPVILFFLITCCVYIPSVLYLGNINEFAMPYYRIVGIILCITVFAGMLLTGLGLSTPDKKKRYLYILSCFFITLGFYIQSNFLNPVMPSLDGTLVDWDSYTKELHLGWTVWGLLGVLFVVFVVLCFLKDIKIEKTIHCVATILCVMQMSALFVTMLTCHLDDNICRVFDKKDQFTVGDENIIMIVVDCLQVEAVQEYIAQNEDAVKILEDFTFFTNTNSGGSSTEYAIPVMLSGVEYDPMQNRKDYNSEVWSEGLLFNDLKEEQYDVRLYTDVGVVPDMPLEYTANLVQTRGNKVKDTREFSKQLMKLTGLYMMPLPMKSYFWMESTDLTKCLESVDEKGNAYRINDAIFWGELKDKKLQNKYKKVFRFYHLEGVHKPYTYDENFNTVREHKTNEQIVLGANISLIKEYIEQLKGLGVYDDSTLIVLGDHGRHGEEDAGKKPAILIKRKGEEHPLITSDVPVCFRNLVATIGGEIKSEYLEYGPGMYDLDERSDTERMQTIAYGNMQKYLHYDGELYSGYDAGRFSVEDLGNGELVYREWNPYEINRIEYVLGEKIDFVNFNQYATRLTERLYETENGVVASNELSVCFDVEQGNKKDLQFDFIYTDVLNDIQKIRIYVNGHKLENVICSTENIGKTQSVIIPKEYVKTDEIVMRMVFPNAVTPNQLNRENKDTRVLSVTFSEMCLKEVNYKGRESERKLFTVGSAQMYQHTLDIRRNVVPYFRTSEFSDIMYENEELIKKLVFAEDEAKAVFLTALSSGSCQTTGELYVYRK